MLDAASLLATHDATAGRAARPWRDAAVGSRVAQDVREAARGVGRGWAAAVFEEQPRAASALVVGATAAVHCGDVARAGDEGRAHVDLRGLRVHAGLDYRVGGACGRVGSDRRALRAASEHDPDEQHARDAERHR